MLDVLCLTAMLLLKKSEIIGICFPQIIEIFQENSRIVDERIYFLHRKRSAVTDNKDKKCNAIYSCFYVSVIWFFPKLKMISKNSIYIDFGHISVIPLVTTNNRKLTCSSIISAKSSETQTAIRFQHMNHDNNMTTYKTLKQERMTCVLHVMEIRPLPQ